MRLAAAATLVGWLTRDRAQMRDVAIGQSRRLTLVARQLRAANEQLARSNEELSAFAARLAHDLRSPLGAVVLTLETLERSDIDLPAETRTLLLRQARRAATRSIDTVQALLDHAAAEGRAADVVPVDIGELAAEVLSTLPTSMLGSIDVTLPEPPAVGWADRHLLPLVLQNLVTNALTHAGPTLGRILIETEASEDGTTVWVEDDGVGIPPERLHEVFAAGTSVGATTGLGLGLATCRSIVERHGGRIWAERSDLGGVAIRFTLPHPSRPSSADRVRDHADGGGDPVVRDTDGGDRQRTLATSSSSGSSSRTRSSPYRPGSAPTTPWTSSPTSAASRDRPSTV